MGFDIGAVTIAMYDKQGKSNGGNGMGSSAPDGKIDNIEFRSALTNALSDKLNSLSFDKKIDLINLVNKYTLDKEILNDKDFQEQLNVALERLNNKISKSGNSWSEPQLRNKNGFWSQIKWY